VSRTSTRLKPFEPTSKPRLSRRDFLRLGLLSLSTVAFRQPFGGLYPEDFESLPLGIGRVTTGLISVYQGPAFSSKRVGSYKRDQIILLLDEILSPQGPAYNKRWYQTPDGYIHSAYLQRIRPLYNQPASYIPTGGQLGEITTAAYRSMTQTYDQAWVPRYQLYYGSLHWVTAVHSGPHSPQPWYQITDELLHVKHSVPARYVRLLSNQELAPINPQVAPENKRIEVSLETQRLIAYENHRPVFQAAVSSGLESVGETPPGQIPTDTPVGRFRIGNKMPSRHMGEGELTSAAEDYELLGVPWVCYFHETGVAFHGTYWHDNFGHRMSHGCVNLRIQDARWIYLWTSPILAPGEWYRIENGTVVDIH
jgi:hypothetical protein